MILPSNQTRRQVQAGLLVAQAKRFAPRCKARNGNGATLYRDLVLNFDAAFRNPSPWRQSGASMHLLPPFFTGALAKRNFERDSLCQKQQKFSRLWRSLVLSQDASALNPKFKTLQAAQRLVQLQQQLRAATPTKLLLAVSSARQLARSLTHKLTHTNTLGGDFAASAHNNPKRRFAFLGQSGVLRFQVA